MAKLRKLSKKWEKVKFVPETVYLGYVGPERKFPKWFKKYDRYLASICDKDFSTPL
jgi:hypothetical protein